MISLDHKLKQSWTCYPSPNGTDLLACVPAQSAHRRAQVAVKNIVATFAMHMVEVLLLSFVACVLVRQSALLTGFCHPFTL